MARNKIAFYGAGNVGATTAHWLAEKGIGDCVLFDIFGQVASGKALDLYESAPAIGFNSMITGSNDPAIISGADVVVVTAGIPRKKDPVTGKFPSRDELVKINQDVITDVARNIKQYAPDSIVVLVTNPLDAMCHVMFEETGFPRERIIGQAGALDTARYKAFIAQELGVSVQDVHGLVLGGHGDTMVPLPRHTSVAGIPVTELISKERLDEIINRTANGGGEIVGLLGYSAYYAPAAGTAIMVESILMDQKRVIPSAVYTQGEYGYSDLFLGLPCVLGRGGVERILDMELNAEERAKLDYSAEAVRAVVDVLGYKK
ncbi:MAG: malate dehydrogenase [Chloroflexi bacterium]|nr:malate dehydrogenase [Chloroflexota bacterium]MDA0246417.1 malate dehydrogenase [Chloroflexota bacterium]